GRAAPRSPRLSMLQRAKLDPASRSRRRETRARAPSEARSQSGAAWFPLRNAENIDFSGRFLKGEDWSLRDAPPHAPREIRCIEFLWTADILVRIGLRCR